MLFNRENFYIEESSLAEALGLGQKFFDEIVESLESSSNEDIWIKEWVHFAIQGYINKTQPVRIFSREGAIAIASYLDNCSKIKVTETNINAVLALFKQQHINQIDVNVLRTVHENSSSLTLKNQRHWLNREDVVKIFKTNSSRLSKAFQSIQRSDNPMKINDDFENQEQGYYFSLSGLEKLSLELSVNLLSEERREYCRRVGEVAPPVLEFLALAPSPSQKEVDKAVRYVKGRDKFCQVTGISRDKYENRLIKLVGHHLYDKNTYRSLADAPDNILTIAEQVSENFHQWNGGNNKTCTVDDFIEYVERLYPQKHEVILMLLNRREALLLRLRQFQRVLPEDESSS